MNDLASTKVRTHIRNKIVQERKTFLAEKLADMISKNRFRKHIRGLIKESKEYTQHEFTGINVLQDLLKQIVPILEKEYKKLTTSDVQRKSFRAHILKSVQNLLATPEVYFNAAKNKGKGGQPVQGQPPQQGMQKQPQPMGQGGLEEGGLGNQQAGGQAPKDPAFIDIGDKSKQPVEAKPEDAFQPIAGEDTTGRNFSLQAFQKIQKQILEEYTMLDSDEDRNMFYEYLLTNLNLYFDRFEDEMTIDPAAVTTPEYDAQKQRMGQWSQGSQQQAPQQGMPPTQPKM